MSASCIFPNSIEYRGVHVWQWERYLKGSDSSKYFVVATNLALAEIGISTAVALGQAISGAVTAANSTGPGAPFVLAGFIASMVATVIGAATKANALANKQKIPSYSSKSGGGTSKENSRPGGRAYNVQKRAKGGFTDYGLTLLGERGTEYVLPNDLLKKPEIAAFTNYAEGIRSGNQQSTNGLPVDNSGTEALLAVLIQKVEMLTLSVEKQKTEMKAYIRYTDIELANEQVNAIKTDAAL